MNFHLYIHSCVAEISLQASVHMQLYELMDCVWQVSMWWLIDACQCPQDRERREDELNELRHILDENHSAVTEWETERRNKAKVQDSCSFIWKSQAHSEATLSLLQNDLFSDFF